MKKEMKLLESYRNVEIVSDDYFDRQYKALLINYYENTEVITTYIYIICAFQLILPIER